MSHIETSHPTSEKEPNKEKGFNAKNNRKRERTIKFTNSRIVKSVHSKPKASCEQGKNYSTAISKSIAKGPDKHSF